MPKARITSPLLMAVIVSGLSACGGAGSTGIVSTPPPPAPTTQTCPDGSVIPSNATCPAPPSPPPQTILSGVTTSQEFASKGATYSISPSVSDRGRQLPAPLLGDGDQLKIRFDATSRTYEIQLPQTQTWLSLVDNQTLWRTADQTVTVTAVGGADATLVRWSAPASFGIIAVANPTNQSAVPRTGSAQYFGDLTGYSSETFPLIFAGRDLGVRFGNIGGTISLIFNFSAGSLAGSINANMSDPGSAVSSPLPPLNFKDTNYAVGSTTFSGKFDTALGGVNSFSGLFAGPTAGAAAGNFAFPYLSVRDGSLQQASGAFTARKRPGLEP